LLRYEALEKGLKEKSAEFVEKGAEDFGYLDYIDTFQSKIEEMTSTLNIVGDATGNLSGQISQSAKALQQLSNQPADVKTVRKLVKVAAEDMNSYAEILGSNLPRITSSRSSAMHALTSALALREDFANPVTTDLTSLRSGLAQLIEVASISARGLSEFRSSVDNLPRMTSDLNKARRAVVGQLDSMLTEINKISHNTENILHSIDKMLNN